MKILCLMILADVCTKVTCLQVTDVSFTLVHDVKYKESHAAIAFTEMVSLSDCAAKCAKVSLYKVFLGKNPGKTEANSVLSDNEAGLFNEYLNYAHKQ